MKKEDVLNSLPKTIDHKTNGKSDLKAIDHGDKKEIYYKSDENNVALSTFNESWENAYNSIKTKLKEENYLTEN